MFIGYFYGIRSERDLERQILTNVAYRWFLGLNLTDQVPHHSTISWNRRTRFKETDIFQEVFDEIVLQAMNHRMMAERVLFTDSTPLSFAWKRESEGESFSVLKKFQRARTLPLLRKNEGAEIAERGFREEARALVRGKGRVLRSWR